MLVGWEYCSLYDKRSFMENLFEKLFEELIESSLPDWILDGIERYLQAFDAGEVEGEVHADDVLDFITSTNPEQDFTDELRVAAKAEIEGYLPLGAPEEYDDGNDGIPNLHDGYDDADVQPEDDEQPEAPRKKTYPPAEDIELHPSGIDTWTLVDTTSGEVLSKPMSKEDAEQLLSHIATKNI